MKKPLYPINQCALYKVGSKARLARILEVSVPALLAMAKSQNYKVFELDEKICPFTQKKTKARFVQEPLYGLKGIHDRLRVLLMRVAPPEYAHAAVKGRSYRSNAVAHVASENVATFDIRKFYPSTSETSVFRFFSEALMIAPDVAGLLATLTCYQSNEIGSKSGLPTGSPVSPILSLYVNKSLFDSLDRLAREHGLIFTCYVDDVTFSGKRLPSGLVEMVKAVIERYGHKMAEDKTRIFSANQPKHITGIVIKDKAISVPYSRFKKARCIEDAISKETDLKLRSKLIQQLSGLLGEAAFLDRRYAGWARASYGNLAATKLKEANSVDTKLFTE